MEVRTVNKGEKKDLKAEIPRELYQAIVRVQAAENMD
jgi:type III secretion system FlhB-like substrate exporter